MHLNIRYSLSNYSSSFFQEGPPITWASESNFLWQTPVNFRKNTHGKTGWVSSNELLNIRDTICNVSASRCLNWWSSHENYELFQSHIKIQSHFLPAEQVWCVHMWAWTSFFKPITHHNTTTTHQTAFNVIICKLATAWYIGVNTALSKALFVIALD